ncbi:MAG: hypothetical protein K8L97_08895 [Anaerolineae bacterium]|nr:hypothetical protein [Anaerolineae bacterium]
MNFLIQLFGPPHESLHWLALRLIGRHALDVTPTHIDIPEDLTPLQYIFVAGLPALVFWGTAALGLVMLINTRTDGDLLGGIALTAIGGLAGLGTMGDIQLIIARLLEEQGKNSEE